MAHTYGPNDYVLGKPTVARREITQTAKQAIPGYSGYKPNYMQGRGSPAPSVAGDCDTGSVCSETRGTARAGGYVGGQHPLGSARSWNAPPGYSGHVPGKKNAAGDHVGQRFTAANRCAISEFARGPSMQDETPLSHDKFHGRVQVPGYSGHMPGVKSDTLVGMSPIKAAKEGWLVKSRETELGGGLVKH